MVIKYIYIPEIEYFSKTSFKFLILRKIHYRRKTMFSIFEKSAIGSVLLTVRVKIRYNFGRTVFTASLLNSTICIGFFYN